MGTHGRGAVGSLLIGSVAQRVVHLAKVPVLLVK
jgi:nucleotide-binding universal stress UspA family protein